MGFYRGPKIITNGLVLALDAANTKSYPGSGTTWSDLSGSDNDGTLTNGPTFDGGSIVFDGINDYFQTSQNDSFGTGPFTIDIWFKPNGNQMTNSSLLCVANTASVSNWQISFNSNILRFFVDSSGVINTTYNATNNNNWVNVVITRVSTGNNGVKIYINGLLDVMGTSSRDYTDVSGYRIGMNRGSNAWFNGSISIVKVYTKSFTSDEALLNYNATKSRFGL